MKTRASSQGKRSRHTYSEEQLAGLRASTAVRKQETLERLRAAIALFRAHSTHLNTPKKRTKRKRKTREEVLPRPPSRDPLLNYKKPQLVVRLREAEQELQDVRRQLATLADACLLRDARVGELEAKLTELEPYRSFVEQVRMRVRLEEHGEGKAQS